MCLTIDVRIKEPLESDHRQKRLVSPEPMSENLGCCSHFYAQLVSGKRFLQCKHF